MTDERPSWAAVHTPAIRLTGTSLSGFHDFDASGANLGHLILPDAPWFVTSLEREDNSEVTLRWMNGQPPYVIEASTSLQPGEWFEITHPTPNQSQRIPITDNPLFLRVRGSGN